MSLVCLKIISENIVDVGALMEVYVCPATTQTSKPPPAYTWNYNSQKPLKLWGKMERELQY